MKRFLAVLTAAVLVAAMMVGAFAANPPAIKDIDVAGFQNNLKSNGTAGFIQLDGKKIASDKLNTLSPVAGSELKIYLTANLFTGTDGKNLTTQAGVTAKTYITKEQIRAGKITVKRVTSKGGAVVESFGIKYDKNGAYISVEFIDPYVSLKEAEFSGSYYLYVDGKRRDETKITIAGTLANKVVEVDSGSDYVNLSDGAVAEALERVSKIDVEPGYGMIITIGMSRGKKYYATCTTDPSDADLDLMERYPEIVEVYTLRTINIAPTNKAVTFDLSDNYHVYDANGQYLGTSNSRVSFSNKYYLSEKKYPSLDIPA